MMSEKFNVSIIIPVYNAEKFIETAIQSILRQNIPWVEIILINDGSKDGSGFICQSYVGNQVKYVYIENAGAGHARNIGIAHATGEWIMFLDSDDLAMSGFFNMKLLLYLKQALESKVDIIYLAKIECDMELIDKPIITYPENKEDISNYMPEIEFWSCIYRAKFLQNEKVDFFEYQKQDIESAFRFRAFSKAKKIWIDKAKIFCVHRKNPTSNINTWNLDNLMEIKALTYWQLFREFGNKEEEVAGWLYTEYLYQVKSLLFRCWKLGFDTKSEQQIKRVLEIDKQENIKIPISNLSIKYKLFCLLVRRLRNYGVIWKSYILVCNRKKRESIEIKKAIQKKDDIELIFVRLEKYKKIVQQEIDSQILKGEK